VVRTVHEKSMALNEREAKQKDLGRHIDQVIRDAKLSQEGVETGCVGRGVCPSIGRLLSRFFGVSRRGSVVSTEEISNAPVAQLEGKTVSSSGSEISRAVFGLAGSKKVTPKSKLQSAAELMKSRVESLENRSAQAKSLAQENMQAGNRAAALRELKRSKALEKQANSTQSALDAIEAQNDMLEQTALQKEVANAIGATAKTLKKEKALLSKAENAVDAAAEMKDIHDDITQVMAGLGENMASEYDDDDLLAELEGMVTTDHASSTTEAVLETISLDDDNESRHENLRLPAAPKHKVAVEKQGLLMDHA